MRRKWRRVRPARRRVRRVRSAVVVNLTPVTESGISGIRRTRHPSSPYALALEGDDQDAGRTFEAQSDTVEASRHKRPSVSGAS
jgi:hypothetical protein